ncbi:MAG TPA: hypothetical protein VKT81_24235 [Bryobacteraceae bacterium]|nr:hypothetical protein [Bryobacteraceae bacterium]
MRFQQTGLAAIALLAGTAVFAQTQPGQLPARNNLTESSQSTSSSTDRHALTIGEKYKLALNHTFDPEEIVLIAASAAINQKRTYPQEWGQGWDAFGVRVASQMGQQLVREQLMFGVWAIDHEDPRWKRSGLTGFWPRTRYAIVHTFITKNDSGDTMLKYSRFVGDYGAGFISREWYPDRFHTAGEGLKAGTISLGFDVAKNVVREFLPHRLSD